MDNSGGGEVGLGYDATGSGLSGSPPPPERPASEMVPPAAGWRGGAAGGGEGAGAWAAAGDGEWELWSADSSERAVIRAVGDEYEGRVYRWRTGPGSPNPFLANGPQVFASFEEAQRYCEANVAPLAE